MFKHILVPVDGSDTSQAALDKAAGLAQAFGARVTAIFVIDPYPFTGVGADFAYGQDQYLTGIAVDPFAAGFCGDGFAQLRFAFAHAVLSDLVG